MFGGRVVVMSDGESSIGCEKEEERVGRVGIIYLINSNSVEV